MKEEIEKRRAEAAEKKKQKEEEVGTVKQAFSISSKGSSKVGLKIHILRQRRSIRSTRERKEVNEINA